MTREKNMRGWPLTAVAGLLTIAATGLALAPAQSAVESDDPIKLTLHDWTG